MKLFSQKSGMTLIEVLIAISLFAITSTIASQIIFNIVEIQQKSSVQSVFYNDTKFILQQIVKEIENGAIDYEEYYNYYVVQSESSDAFVGTNYGAYSSRFYNPGKRLDGAASKNPQDLGLECSFPNGADIDDCEIFYTLATDLNTGANPFKGAGATYDYENSNAFCDDPNGATCSTATDLGYTDILFLLDSTGTKKTIIGKKAVSGDEESFALSKLEMEGLDIDQNGVIDTWRCKDEYSCVDEVSTVVSEIGNDYVDANTVSEYNISIPTLKDLEGKPYSISTDADDFHSFVPITPLRANVENLTFIVHPIEDPYKAFAEPDSQAHPSVTIILTVGLNPNFADSYPGEFSPITVQTTVTAGVLSKINSYPPTKDVSWIDELEVLPDVP